MRRTVPPRILAMVYITAALALAGTVAVLVTVPLRLGARPALEALGLGLTLLLARRFPVHLTEKTKTTLSTVPLFAAVLLLSPPWTLLAVIGGMVAAEFWRRTAWFQGLFNSSVGVIQAALGSLVVGLLAG